MFEKYKYIYIINIRNKSSIRFSLNKCKEIWIFVIDIISCSIQIYRSDNEHHRTE